MAKVDAIAIPFDQGLIKFGFDSKICGHGDEKLVYFTGGAVLGGKLVAGQRPQVLMELLRVDHQLLMSLRVAPMNNTIFGLIRPLSFTLSLSACNLEPTLALQEAPIQVLWVLHLV